MKRKTNTHGNISQKEKNYLLIIQKFKNITDNCFLNKNPKNVTSIN